MRASELERLQSRQGEIVNAHARVGGELRELVIPSAIPDSGLLHDFDASAISASDQDPISTFPDTKGGNDATGSGTFVESVSDLGNESGVSLDGSDDEFINTNLSHSQPLVAFSVFTDASGASIDQGFIFRGNNRFGQLAAYDSNEWRIDAGTPLRVGPLDTDPYIFTGVFDGVSSSLRLNGSEASSGDAGTNSMDGISIGSGDGLAFLDFTISRLLIYDESQMESGQISDVESSLNDKYGVY